MKLSKPDMVSATQLTRSGKLIEATALIQKMLGVTGFTHTAGNKAGSEMPTVNTLTGAARSPVLLKIGQRSETELKDTRWVFETKNYASVHGARAYKLFIPIHYEGQPLPLVVMLHGCNQTPDDFAAGTNMNALAAELGFIVAYPEQPSSENAMGCWNWFKSSDQKKDSGEPAIIAGIVQQIKTQIAIDEERVYVAGLSAGGAMAAILGMTHSDVFAAIGVHSGLPCGAATNISGAFRAMKRGSKNVPVSASVHPVPAIVFHGDQDTVVDPVNSDSIITQFNTSRQLSRTKESGKSDDGMAYSREAFLEEKGSPLFEQWTIHEAGHAWSGGNAKGSYTEPRGPDASREMIRFFFQHRLK